MKNIILVAVGMLSLLTACSSSPSAPPIEGKLIVHTGVKPTGGASVHVLLGDGTKFVQAVDANGDATFQDNAIQGAQTVTLVEENGGTVSAITVVSVNRGELWLPGSVQSNSNSSVVGTVSGNVTGIADAGDWTSVSLLGGGADGYGTASGGAFSFQVYAPDAGADAGTRTGALLALEEDTGFNPIKAGLRTGVPIGGDVTGQDVTLDHPVDQTFTLTVSNANTTYGSSINANLLYLLDNRSLFSTSASGASPLSLPAIAQTAPFDGTQLVAELNIGSRTSLPNGRLNLSAGVSGSSGNLTVPTPLAIGAPPISDRTTRPTVSATGFKLDWTTDPQAQVAYFELGDGTVDWQVVAPASAKEFVFFPLPASASTVSGLIGNVTLNGSEIRYDQFGSYEDYFATDTDSKSNSSTGWQTEVRGYLTLQ